MMRTSCLVLHGLLLGALLSGCGDSGSATTETDTGATTGSGTTTDGPTTGPTTGATTSDPSCVPGASSPCTCTSGDPGAQVCAPDGKSYGECTCEGGGSDSDSESNSNSNTDPTTEPGTTTGVSATTESSGTTDGETTTGGTTTGEETDGTTTLGETLGDTENMVCTDPGPEPNDDEADAVEQDDQMCNAMPGSIDGVLDGDADVDWFTYHTVDAMGCGFGDPATNLVLLADQGVRLCAFVECDQGDAEFNCPMMAMDEDSPEGLPGCCTTSGALNFGLNCMGSMNESADIFVRLDEAPADACVAYNLTYTWGPV